MSFCDELLEITILVLTDFHYLHKPIHLQRPRKAPGGTKNAFWTHSRRMVQTEGAMSLMNGLVPSMWREIAYSGIRLGAYEFFKDS